MQLVPWQLLLWQYCAAIRYATYRCTVVEHSGVNGSVHDSCMHACFTHQHSAASENKETMIHNYSAIELLSLQREDSFSIIVDKMACPNVRDSYTDYFDVAGFGNMMNAGKCNIY